MICHVMIKKHIFLNICLKSFQIVSRWLFSKVFEKIRLFSWLFVVCGQTIEFLFIGSGETLPFVGHFPNISDLSDECLHQISESSKSTSLKDRTFLSRVQEEHIKSQEEIICRRQDYIALMDWNNLGRVVRMKCERIKIFGKLENVSFEKNFF